MNNRQLIEEVENAFFEVTPSTVCEQYVRWAEEAVKEWDGVCNSDLIDLIAEKFGITTDQLLE